VIAGMTVIFPRLSDFETRREKALLRAEFGRGIFVLSVIILPSMVGICSFDGPILDLLFIGNNLGRRT
jgi:peptidoglycan biosynthesis protein MviN/MurJ (putative lipid II flippase)